MIQVPETLSLVEELVEIADVDDSIKHRLSSRITSWKWELPCPKGFLPSTMNPYRMLTSDEVQTLDGQLTSEFLSNWLSPLNSRHRLFLLLSISDELESGNWQPLADRSYISKLPITVVELKDAMRLVREYYWGSIALVIDTQADAPVAGVISGFDGEVYLFGKSPELLEIAPA